MKIKCDVCKWETENKKSFSNHTRNGCIGRQPISTPTNCIDCNKKLVNCYAKRCNTCSGLQHKNVVLGEKNPNWKGGVDDSYYKYRVQKKECDLCKSPDKLEIHHRDGNHYNNQPENWQVVCRRCHMNIDGRINNLIRGKIKCV